jgi:hypothetical protein
MTNTERRELTAAEIDLVGGGVELENCMISGFPAFSWSEHQTGTALYDVRQSKAV